MSGYPTNRELAHRCQDRLLVTASFSDTYSAEYERPGAILFRDQDLFLAQKIEVGVTAGARIDNRGKVPGKIIGVTSVRERKNKGNFQRHLRRARQFAVFPGLAVNRNFTTGSNRIQKRFAVRRKNCVERYDAREQYDAFPIRKRDLVDSRLFS